MRKLNRAKLLLLLLLVTIFMSCQRSKSVSILSYGAIADGVTVNSEAIQEAIDDVSQSGGE